MLEKKNIGPKGQQIQLKVIEPADLPKVYEWKNDYELAGMINAHPLPTATHQVQEWFEKNQADKNQVLFGIYLTEGMKFLGIIRLMFIDWINSNADLGIYIGEKNCRGKGIGKEAVALIVNYAFKDLNLHKINLKVSEANTGAAATYKACGFKTEGILKDQFWFNDKFENVLAMGIINPR
jgi:RimJ/RimL family protein N-acetyltransferase